MSRSLFLLITGIYTTLLSLSMVFATEMSLISYGTPQVDLSHVSIMQFLGVSSMGLGLLALLNRHAPNSAALRNTLLALAVTTLAGIVLGIYHVYLLHVPFSTFFVVDSLFRLVLGLGYLYFYNRETRLAQVGAVLV
ncbi:MAG: hypothetical protein H7Z72_12305 [Bacteroidetes bacterium]|nr:hypothetical protein [Fibrella sp.]